MTTRRAARSCLSTLEQLIIIIQQCSSSSIMSSSSLSSFITSSDLEGVIRNVMESILYNKKSTTSTTWRNGVHSLHELLLHDQSCYILIANLEYIWEAFQLLLNQSSIIRHRQCDHTTTREEHEHNDPTNSINHERTILLEEEPPPLPEMKKGGYVLGWNYAQSQICTTLKVLLTLLVRDDTLCKLLHHSMLLQPQDVGYNTSRYDIRVRMQCVLSDIVHLILTPVLQSRASSADALVICGVLFGQILLCQWTIAGSYTNVREEEEIAMAISCFVHGLKKYYSAAITTDNNTSHDHIQCSTPPFDNDNGDNNASAISNTGDDIMDTMLQHFTTGIVINGDNLLPLNQLAIIRGITATLPNCILSTPIKGNLECFYNHNANANNDYEYGTYRRPQTQQKHQNHQHPEKVSLIRLLGLFIVEKAHTSKNDAVRISAMNGLETLLGLFLDIIQLNDNDKLNNDDNNNNDNDDDAPLIMKQHHYDNAINDNDDNDAPLLKQHQQQQHQHQQHNDNANNLIKEATDTADQALEVVLSMWESPQCRRIRKCVPGLFHCIICLMNVVDDGHGHGYGHGHDHGHRRGEDDVSSSFTSIERLTKKVLKQPSNRKGRYIAIQALLPIIGATKLMELHNDGESDEGRTNGDNTTSSLLSSLVHAVGNRGNNAGVVAALLGKVASTLCDEMHLHAGIDLGITDGGNKKQRRRERIRKRTAAAAAATANTTTNNATTLPKKEIMMETSQSQLLPIWIEAWAIPLAQELLGANGTRRNRIASFCLPLVVTMVSGGGGGGCGGCGSMRRLEACHAFAVLLDQVELQSQSHGDGGGGGDGDSRGRIPYTHNNSRTTDMSGRLLWAKLQIAHHAAEQNLLTKAESSSTTNHVLTTTTTTQTTQLQRTIARTLPLATLRSALMHERMDIRMVAFSAMEAVVSTYDTTCDTYNADDADPSSISECSMNLEVKLWKEILPYAFQWTNKEFITRLLIGLNSLMTRMLLGMEEQQEQLIKFVISFLLNDLFVKQTAYPGTVYDKEIFAVALLQSIFAFATCESHDGSRNRHRHRAHRNRNSKPSKLRPKQNVVVTDRCRLTDLQQSTTTMIMEALLGQKVLSSLWTLLSSLWDETRKNAHDLFCQLLQLAQYNTNNSSKNHRHTNHYQIPSFLLPPPEEKGNKTTVQLRPMALHLASSLRQREADSGARMLSILYCCCCSLKSSSLLSLLPKAKHDYILYILHMVKERIATMETVLGLDELNVNAAAASESSYHSKDNTNESHHNESHNDGNDNGLQQSLPLAHGLVQSLRLIVENMSLSYMSSSSSGDGDLGAETGGVHVHAYELLIREIAITCCHAIDISLIVVSDFREEVMEGSEGEGSEVCSTLLRWHWKSWLFNVNNDDKIKRAAVLRVVVREREHTKIIVSH